MRHLALAVVCSLFAAAARAADDPKPEDLLGKWELTETLAGIPKGALCDFQKGGKLVVRAEAGGAQKASEYRYELKGKALKFFSGDKSDTTEVVRLDRTELVCKDSDGTTAKFKRLPGLEDLLGKWELTEDAAGIPKGAIFDFQKDGKLVVAAQVDGEKKTFDFKYELKEKQIKFTIGEKSDTTEIIVLDRSELICKDKDGTTAKFKRAK